MPYKSIEDQVGIWLDMPALGASFFMVIKPTQVGFTTTLIKKSTEKGLKITVIEPTNKIIDETVAKASANFLKISRNDVMCPISKPDPLFDWETRGNCNFCKEKCLYKEVINNTTSNLALTYHKLLALSSASKTEFLTIASGSIKTEQALLATGLMERILQSDVIFCDEFPTTLAHFTGFNADIIQETFNNLSKCKMTPIEYKAYERLSTCFNAIISHVLDKPFNNPNILELNKVKELGLGLIKFVSANAKNEFRNFLLSLTNDELIIFTNKKGKIVQVKQDTFMRRFLDEIAIWGFKGKVFVTGAKMPDIKDLQGFTELTMPDFNNTEQERLVVLDKADWDFNTKWYREKGKVKAILETLTDSLKGEKILVIAINKKIADDIKSWNLKGVDAEEYYYYTYYRSEDSMGIRLPYRVLVCVGMPHTPKDSYKGHDLIYGEPPGTFRSIEMKDALVNALGRGKDPEGKERSIVFMLGAKLSDFKAYYPNKVEVVETFKQGTLPLTASAMAFLWLRHKAKDFQDLPKISEVLRLIEPSQKYNLGNFAWFKLWMKADDFIAFFNKNASLFPPNWQIKNIGKNGHQLCT